MIFILINCFAFFYNPTWIESYLSAEMLLTEKPIWLNRIIFFIHQCNKIAIKKVTYVYISYIALIIKEPRYWRWAWAFFKECVCTTAELILKFTRDQSLSLARPIKVSWHWGLEAYRLSWHSSQWIMWAYIPRLRFSLFHHTCEFIHE